MAMLLQRLTRKTATREVRRGEVQGLAARGVPIVDVLPSEEYEREHIAGALSIPLPRLDAEAPVRLRRNVPVVVYCFDHQ
jgi:rhodanese-related sulfurtransferase